MASEWLILTLIAVFAYAGVDILEKRLIITRFNNPFKIAIFLAIFYPLHLVILSLIGGIDMNIITIIISFFTGIAMSFSYLLFMRSLMLEELSRVSILGYIHPLFVALLAYLFLEESLTLLEYCGIVMIVISIVIISYKGSLKASRALIPMLLFNIILAVKSIIAKYLLYSTDYWSYLFWFMLGLILSRTILLINKEHRSILSNIDKRLIIYGFAISILFLIANLAFYYAISLTSVSLVVTISTIEPLIILLIIYIIDKIRRGFINEDITNKILIHKVIASLLVIFGIYILSI